MKNIQNDPLVPDEVKREVKKYEIGQSLLSIPEVGYEALLEILTEEIESDERKLLAYRDSNPDELFGMLRELQGKRKAKQNLEVRVKSLTASASEPSPLVQKYIATY